MVARISSEPPPFGILLLVPPDIAVDVPDVAPDGAKCVVRLLRGQPSVRKEHPRDACVPVRNGAQAAVLSTLVKYTLCSLHQQPRRSNREARLS